MGIGTPPGCPAGRRDAPGYDSPSGRTQLPQTGAGGCDTIQIACDETTLPPLKIIVDFQVYH